MAATCAGSCVCGVLRLRDEEAGWWGPSVVEEDLHHEGHVVAVTLVAEGSLRDVVGQSDRLHEQVGLVGHVVGERVGVGAVPVEERRGARNGRGDGGGGGMLGHPQTSMSAAATKILRRGSKIIGFLPAAEWFGEVRAALACASETRGPRDTMSPHARSLSSVK